MAADPVISPAASAAILGLSSGLAGSILLQFGLTLPLLTWAALGCVVGVSWAPTVGRYRAAALFIAAALLSAKGGAVAAHYWWASSTEMGQGVAAALGIFFHPLLSALIKALPTLLKRPAT